MKWKFDRWVWHSQGQCWSWLKVRKYVYYCGNQVYLGWGRIALVFSKRKWIYSKHTSLELEHQLKLDSNGELIREEEDRLESFYR
jgi:hypothetical protein